MRQNPFGKHAAPIGGGQETDAHVDPFPLSTPPCEVQDEELIGPTHVPLLKQHAPVGKQT